MNTRLLWNRTGRHCSFLALMLLGLLAGGYGLQSLLHAQNPTEAGDAPGKPEGQAQMTCPMMAGLKGVELYADSPTLLMAQAEELRLSDEQKKQLEEIVRSARQQAHQALTAEQQEALEKQPEGPLSPMQIAKMRMKGKMREDNSKMMCPMCMKMMMNKKMQETEEEADQ